jgi:hypothetical protein
MNNNVMIGAVKKPKKLTLYKMFDNYLRSKDGSDVYIYEKGILYDTDRYGKKTTSYRMSKIDLVVK